MKHLHPRQDSVPSLPPANWRELLVEREQLIIDIAVQRQQFAEMVEELKANMVEMSQLNMLGLAEVEEVGRDIRELNAMLAPCGTCGCRRIAAN